MPSDTRWWRLLGSRFCVDPTAWILLTPIAIVAAPLAAPSAAPSRDGLLHWLLIGLVAQIPLGIVLILGGRLAMRMRDSRAAVIAVTFAAGATRGLVIALLGDTTDLLTRMASSAVTMAVWLAVIGAARESRRRFDAEVDLLLGELVARELHGRLLDASERDQAGELSSQRIAEASSELRAIVDDSSGDHVRTAALLQAAIETRLRPLSHDLWFSPAPIAPQAHRYRDLLHRIITAGVPAFPLFIAALLLLSWGSLVLHDTWQGVWVGVTISVAYGLVLTLADLPFLSPVAGAVIRYLGSMTIPALVGWLTIALLHLGEPWSPVAVALSLPVITGLVAAASTLRADRADLLEELRARLAEPDWDRHLGELVRREVDTNAATMLHNSVQPALTAAALQLHLAAALNEPERARAALGRASRALDEAQDFRGRALPGRARLERVAEAWQGIADVRIGLPSAELDASEWGLLADVADETIANAVRHGKATTVSIDIEARPEILVITVIEDSVDNRCDRPPGLGRTWLDSVVTSGGNRTTDDGRGVRHMSLPRRGASGLAR